MTKFTPLVLSVVLGAVCTATATAQTIETPGQTDARIAFQLCGAECDYNPLATDRPVASFSVIPRFGAVVRSDETRQISTSFGSGNLYVRRQVADKTYYYEPNLRILVDEDPFLRETGIIYTYLYVWSPGGRAAQRMEVGFVLTHVQAIPDDAVIPFGVDGFSVTLEPQRCSNCVSATPAGWYTVTLVGDLPERFWATPSSTDGNLLSLNGEQVLVENGELSFARFTNTRAAVSITLRFPNGEFQTLPNLFTFGKGVVSSRGGGSR